MQKIIITLVLILTSLIASAQNQFDKFNGMEDVQTVVVNKKMFELMGKVKMDSTDEEAQKYLNLVKKLDNLKVFVTSNTKISGEMRNIANNYIKTAQMEELMSINDSGQSVRIMIRSGKKESQIKELFMFVDGKGKDNQTVILSLTGDFNLDELSILTDKMNLPAGEEIKKASKGKK